jgi:enoyl-CoA hydratase/carnithine racemase
MDQGPITKKVEGKVCTILLSRPEKRNAINGDMIDALDNTFNELAYDGSIHVVVLAGEGPMFSSGIDLNYLGGLAGTEPNLMGAFVRKMANRIQNLMNNIESLEKPVVAACHTHCGGLGMELAMACDFRLASSDAIFGLPEMIMGLVADCGGTTRITRTLGVARAKELLMLGDMIPAEQALQWGLVNRVFPLESFQEGVTGFVEKLLDRPIAGLGVGKKLVDYGASVDKQTFQDIEAMFQSILITSPDFMTNLQEGMAKIRAMRKKD